jgi:hypothetical protein
MRRLSVISFSVGLVISSLVGTLHFFTSYGFAWYSYIPEVYREIYASIDYVNFFFSLLLTEFIITLIPAIYLLRYKKIHHNEGLN